MALTCGFIGSGSPRVVALLGKTPGHFRCRGNRSLDSRLSSLDPLPISSLLPAVEERLLLAPYFLHHGGSWHPLTHEPK